MNQVAQTGDRLVRCEQWTRVWAARRADRTWAHIATVEFRAADLFAGLVAVGMAERWTTPPAAGRLIISSWEKNHPRSLTAVVEERILASGGEITFSSRDSLTWPQVVNACLSRAAARRAFCVACHEWFDGVDVAEGVRGHTTAEHLYRQGVWQCPRGHVLATSWSEHQSPRGGSFVRL